MHPTHPKITPGDLADAVASAGIFTPTRSGGERRPRLSGTALGAPGYRGPREFRKQTVEGATDNAV